MKCITTIKKFFGLSMIGLLLAQPALVAGNTLSTEAKTNRTQPRRTTRKKTQPITSNAATPLEPEITNPEDLRQAVRSARKENEGSFEKNVEKYIRITRETYAHKDPASKLFADALQNMVPKEKDNVPAHKRLGYMRKVIEPLKNQADFGLQSAEVSQANQQLGLAVLLKAVLPLGVQTQASIYEMLHKLDNYIAYWQEQKHHPIKHFFHKSPEKWFSGPKQKTEIEQNIKWLKAAREDHLLWLFELTSHEGAFYQKASPKEQYKWLAGYMSIILKISFNIKRDPASLVSDESKSFINCHALICWMLTAPFGHEANIMRTLGNAKKAGHFTRNWLRYTGLAIGSGLFAWYAYRNQEKFSNWVYDEAKVGLVNFGTSAFNSGRDFIYALIGKSAVRPGNNGIERQQTIDEQLVQFQARLRGLRDNLLGDNQPYENDEQLREAARAERARDLQENAHRQCREVVNAYQQTRNQLVQDRLLIAQEVLPNLEGLRFEDLRAIIRQILGNALADCNRIAAQLNVPQEAAPGLAAPAVPVGDAPQMPANLQFGYGLGVNLGQPVNDEINNYIRQAHHFAQHHLPQIRNLLNNDVSAYQKSIPAVGRLAGDVIALLNAYITLVEIYGNNLVIVGADLIDTVANTIEPVRTEVARNQATIILTSLAPAGVVLGGSCFGLSKLYKALKRKPDFRPIREALIDIGHLLNEDGMVKSDDKKQEKLDQATVLYLVWKLKREIDNVPAQQRDQFMADVSRLGGSIWTAEKKLRIIDLMYRTYDFLNPAYVAQ